MLSFVTLIAYDYSYALRTIASYYAIADEIILGIDKDRISFANKPYAFDDEHFYQAIKKIDPHKKVKIVEQNFHLFARPMDNDQYERKVLSEHCKSGNWILQIDADEFLLNAQEFREWIRNIKEDVAIMARWVTVFKQFGDQYLMIEEPDAFIHIGTKNRNRYVASRITDEPELRSPLVLLHQAWNREREQLEQKLRNWAHSLDFNVDSYLSLWESVTIENHREFKNFHPFVPTYWPSLEVVRLKSST